MSQHTSPLQPTPEQAPHGLPPQDARVFEFPTGQELHRESMQTGVEAPYDWAKEKTIGKPENLRTHIGVLSSSGIDFEQPQESPRAQDSVVTQVLGRVAHRYGRAKDSLGMTIVPAPQKAWKAGENQLDHLPKSLRKPR